MPIHCRYSYGDATRSLNETDVPVLEELLLFSIRSRYSFPPLPYRLIFPATWLSCFPLPEREDSLVSLAHVFFSAFFRSLDLCALGTYNLSQLIILGVNYVSQPDDPGICRLQVVGLNVKPVENVAR